MVRRQRRTGLLDDRARLILRALVEEHIRTALPVGSSSIAASYRLGVSSATVRGVLAELEDLGLVAQPHTSAAASQQTRAIAPTRWRSPFRTR